MSYQGLWGYHPPLILLANMGEPLYLVNRSGNPTSSQSAAYLDRAIALCRNAGFHQILLRGDSDFSQAEHLDRWDEKGVRFVFDMDAMANLVAIASCPGIHGCGCSSERSRPCIFHCSVDGRDKQSRCGRRDMTGLRERRTRSCTWNIDNSNAPNQPTSGPASGILAPHETAARKSSQDRTTRLLLGLDSCSSCCRRTSGR